MTIAIGQSVSLSNAFADNVTTGAITTAASGSSFIVAAARGNARPATITDSKSNTYSAIGTAQSTIAAGTGAYLEIFLCENGVGGSGHTFTGDSSLNGGTYWSIFGIEITGGVLSGLVDVFSQNQDAATAFDGSSITPTAGARLLLAFAASDGQSGSSTRTHTAGNSFTIVSGLNIASSSVSFPLVAAQRSVTGDGVTSYNSTFTESNNSTEGMGLFTLALKEASGGGGSIYPGILTDSATVIGNPFISLQ